MIRKIVGIHFSPIGGTANMTRLLTEDLASRLRENSPVEISTEMYELMRLESDAISLDDETIAVIGVPVYVGKVPLPALRMLKSFIPDNTVAVTAVSYGARTYGNALYELQHFTEEMGFKVIGAGAFSVRYRKHAGGDSTTEHTGDIESLRKFGEAAASKIMRLSGSEIEGLRIRPVPLELEGRIPVHRISRLSPRAAEVAQDLLERICVRRRSSEWYL